MKTKPNFTYKEFIEKIAQVPIPIHQNNQSKSPRILKCQNKNVTSSSYTYHDKPFQKKILNQDKNSRKTPSKNLTPRRTGKNQNFLDESIKQNNLKNQTNKKLQLKNQLNTDRLASHQQSLKQSKKFQQGPNFSYNQSCYQYERHNESCSTFYKNKNQDIEDQNLYNGVSVNKSSRLKMKKDSTGSIEGRLKVLSKGNKTERNGNLTDRNGKRVLTQYEQKSQLATDRLTTQYEKKINRNDRQSPSFYKLSADESSFLDFEEDKSHKNLFGQSSFYCAKKSSVSLLSQDKNPKLNQKSYEHIYNKFITTISQILFQITKIQNQNQLLEHKIKYIEFLECLKELKMIKSDYEPYSMGQGVDLVKQFWQELVMGHNVNHFIIIVGLVLKITTVESIKGQNVDELQNCLYLQKKYEQFRFTRLQLDRSKHFTEKQSSELYNFPFKPNISKNSDQIASRQKSLKRKFKINTSVNHNNSISQNQTKRQNLSVNEDLQQNQFAISKSLRMTSPLGNKRSQMLYKQAKKKSLQKRQNKSTIDYQYEKNKDQLTFKPKIIIKRKKQPTEDPTINFMSPRFVQDEEKAINRIIRGRVERQVKQMTIDRGLPYNEKTVQKLRRQKFEQIIKEQQQSRLKKNQQSYCKLKLSQTQTKMPQNFTDTTYQRCTTQVQNLQNILNLSFEAVHKQNLQNQQENIQPEELLTNDLQYSPLKTQNLKQDYHESQQNNDRIQQSPEDFFTLDIYFEQDRSEKLMIRRDSTIEGVILQAEKFVQKHQLPKEMQQKLKQQLMIAMKFHDIEKIEEYDQEEQCSLVQ